MGYKLIACDLDETLLDDNHRIAKKNCDAIKKAREKYGIPEPIKKKEKLAA